ncbi:MAG: hypothetical protein AAF802_33365, partial [Planctomycetota bacterium]
RRSGNKAEMNLKTRFLWPFLDLLRWRFVVSSTIVVHGGHRAYRKRVITIGYTTSGEVGVVGVVSRSSPPRDP